MSKKLAFEVFEDRVRELLRWTPNVPSAVWLGALMGLFIGTSTLMLGLMSSMPEMRAKWKVASLVSFAVVVAFTPMAIGYLWPAAGATVAIIQVGSFLTGVLLGKIPQFKGSQTTMAAMILARI